MSAPAPLRALAPLGPIWRPFAARRVAVGLGSLCALLAGGALLGLPVAAGRALDAAGAGDASGVTLWVGAFAASVAVEALLRFAARSLLVGASRDAEADLKDRVQEHLLRLPVRWFDRHPPGEVVSRLTQDVEAMRFTTGPALLYGLQALTILPLGLAVLLATTPALGAVALTAFAGLALYLLRLAPKLRTESTAVQQALGEVGARAGEAFAAIRFVQAARRVEAETQAIAAASENLRDRSVRLARVQARTDLGIHATTELVLFAGLCLGGMAVAEGSASPGDLLGFYALLGVQLAPLLALGFVLGGLPRALGAAARIQEILDAEVSAGAGASAGPPDATQPGSNPPRIEVRDLSCRLDGSDEPALSGVSFTVEPGQTLGICGPVGSGKSTLVDLLLRLEDPEPGRIFVDGEDVLTIAPDVLRARTAVALQDPFLLRDTVAANASFGGTTNDEDVRRAIRDAELEREIEALEGGLQARIGERGMTLSGGQRQRLALARALACGKPFVVLDDPLSAVDVATERAVLGALRTHLEGRTAILTAHRLSTVRIADRILYLERGRLLGHGTHAELLATCPPYAAAWHHQQESHALEGDG
ncbi:MAG: ABC transporter ATP-binding protein [Planctomycetota bacterium]|nr:ABC transporter ATP-binding protein [Planctomycetota bacterium]